MRVATARISYLGTSQELVIDTSIKSGTPGYGVLLAPTWQMVMDYKHHKITWEQYSKLYRELLLDRYHASRVPFMRLIEMEKVVVFKCYCNKSVRPCCHRYLLVGIFERLCESYKIPFEYLGESQ